MSSNSVGTSLPLLPRKPMLSTPASVRLFFALSVHVRVDMRLPLGRFFSVATKSQVLSLFGLDVCPVKGGVKVDQLGRAALRFCQGMAAGASACAPPWRGALRPERKPPCPCQG